MHLFAVESNNFSVEVVPMLVRLCSTLILTATLLLSIAVFA